MTKQKQKIIVIVGPTSAGKTGLSITLAKAVGGEVISADSRQVYRGLDIGTGKVTAKEMRGVPHHLLDVTNPRNTFTASEFVRLGRLAIMDITSRGKVPIVVGGTGFYIDALLGGVVLPEVAPNKKLRKMLSQKSLVWLQSRLKSLDLGRYKTIDLKNPVRLIRAIEIATALGSVPKTKPEYPFEALFLGIQLPMPNLSQRIHARLLSRMKSGMLAEAKRLYARGLSLKRMNDLGLEYRFLALHIGGKITRTEMLLQLEAEIIKYAKRQMTWFKRNKKINWLAPNNSAKAISLSKKFLTTTA